MKCLTDITQVWDIVGMLIEAARRAEAAVKEMLAIVNDGSATAGEYREALGISKSIVGISSVFQTSTAKVIAKVERHGDGGAEVLSDAAGLSRRDAHSQVKTARVIEAAPAVRDAVESGRVSQANARRLAEAVETTGADAVESDAGLLAKAESMRPEQFRREARRWVTDHQRDGGESEHARQRARRCVRIWDGDDGMVHLRGVFDPVTGRRVANRLQADAARMFDADKKNTTAPGQRRSFQQCMADALDRATANHDAPGGGKAFVDICVIAHVDNDTGKLIAELPDGSRLPAAVLEELACGAKLTGVIYDRVGTPIWRARSVRRATDAQRQILIARYGGCFACGAHPALCDIHHIEPVSRGGSTKLDNLVPACWHCHTKIHHHNWQIHRRPDGFHTLHPPDHVTHGPARAPDQPSLLMPDIESRLAPLLAGRGTQHEPESADGRVAGLLPGPAAARSALRGTRPVPLFTPD